MGHKRKDTIVLGLALFSIFFGAGNLIFPPYIGILTGKNYMYALIGFFITGIFLPHMGLVVVSVLGGTLGDLTDRVSRNFTKVLGSLIMLSLGPFLAVPRTAATAFEMALVPNFGKINPLIFSIIYFVIVWILAINSNSVVDKVGKILTPILLLFLGLLIIKGIANPISSFSPSYTNQNFYTGFSTGYQTMDALGSILTGFLMLTFLDSKKYTEKKDRMEISVKASILSGILILFIYGGLIRLGAYTGTIFTPSDEKTYIMTEISKLILGSFSKIALGLCITFACFTTATGLTSIVGEYFQNLSNGKIKYKVIVTLVCVSGIIFSAFGVEGIIKIAVPILSILYPVVIVLILLGAFSKILPDRIYQGATIFTLIFSIIDVANKSFPNIKLLEKIVSTIPLGKYGFVWVIPSIVGGILFSFIKMDKILEKEDKSPI
ncbi:branched-chain amino acid transport system carrier protein BraB [Gottschalkia purinilytica]|uniref:Branched-chain amino acid transport system carrier protein n=1 Tax=Gottschalkia purinilytica TaxID=1503 RepID=A0A0L0WA26_GOTPU|nr:branched-chain amino acid transport system II carrier protein [Gottschalkia purinilytica]KNF08165.1 branched-chain amino acid transport system carrier protein BraB [Gottschalkia purinilytica]